MSTNYDVDYFIKKFEAIPEDKWITHDRVNDFGQRCALGWCYPNDEEARRSQFADNRFDSDEDKALCAIVHYLNPGFGVGGINNGLYHEYSQPTPKQRSIVRH